MKSLYPACTLQQSILKSRIPAILQFPTALCFLIFLLISISQTVVAQTCCLTNSLNVSTGFDPTTGSVSPTGSADPKWTLTSLSGDCVAVAAGLGLSTGAIDINRSGAWPTPMTGTRYVSFMDSCCFTGTATATYSMTVTRTFHLCRNDTVTFDLFFYADDYITGLNVDGGPLSGPTIFPNPTTCGYGMDTPLHLLENVILAAGDHSINVTVGNCALAGLVGQGLDVSGTVTTHTLTLINEHTGCTSSFPYCTEPAITGLTSVCQGSTITLSDAYTGGTWSSSNTAIGTVGSASGIVGGISGGAVTISYTDPCNRVVTYAVTVNTAPPIHGTMSICAGATTTLTDSISGGTWSSSNTVVATISTAGVVTGVSTITATSTTTISYAFPNGCVVTAVVTVNPLPSVIHGTLTVCAGLTTSVSDDITGGTWSSSNTSVATIGASTGIIGGVSTVTVTSTATITYTTAAGCTKTAVVTVNPAPKPVSGAGAICGGATLTLSDLTVGGAWSSSNTGIATVSTAGVVTGVSTVTATSTVTISYTLPTGCASAAVVTVNPQPGPITGGNQICLDNSNLHLSDSPTGGTWTSSNTGVATVGSASGIVNGVSTGTTIITYTAPGGCFVTEVVTVNPTVLPSPILGPDSVCVGLTVTLSDATTGGAWTSGATGVATISSSTGVVTGISSGATYITYTLPTGCFATMAFTVNALPLIVASPVVCVGSSITLSDGAGVIWSSTSSHVTVGSSTGIVTGISTGTAIITYQNATTTCLRTLIATVNPAVGNINGTLVVCQGSTTALSDASAGGTWSSTATGIATISTSGVVTGVSGGTTTISYLTSVGCYTTAVVTVNPSPAPITGNLIICGTTGSTTLSDATAGGTWSESSTLISVVGSTGVVTGSGLSTGTATVTYTLSTGCNATAIVTLSPLPMAITGLTSICLGVADTLNDATAGGTWTSSATGVATITATTGIVTTIAPGTTTISYTLSTGCARSVVFTVKPLPGPIQGNPSVCVGFTTNLSDTTSGVSWASGNTSVATVGGSGVVTGVTPGTAIITYTGTNTCKTTIVVTVNPVPTAILGTKTLCIGSTTPLSDTTAGGTWSSSVPTVGTIGSASGIVTGLATGTTRITYMLPTGCYITAVVTVSGTVAAISGIPFMCMGHTTTLSDATAGGTWSSGNPGVATVGSTGIVSSVSAGTAVISYATSPTCYATVIVTVYAQPTPIAGNLSVCMESTSTLSDSLAGTWSSSNTGVATIGSATGIITPVSVGTTTIVFTPSDGCTLVSAVVTVNPRPASISGTLSVCPGTTTTLTDATTGGTWSSNLSGTASVGSGSGVVLGVSPGTAVITYTLPTGCYITAIVTVNPPPAAISGTLAICLGQSTTLSDGGGGTWSSGNTGVAVIGSSSGVVNSISLGTTTITYTLGTGCITTAVFTVNPLPSVITGTLALCAGTWGTVTDTIAGGTWSTVSGVITLGGTSGLITGISSGTAVITYTLPTGCFTTAIATVNALPASITGTLSVCVGSTTNLTDATTGGSWSSGSPAIGSIGSASGIVTGLSPGTTVITYTLPTGCFTKTIVTINPLPTGILGSLSVCVGFTTSLSDLTTGGTWISVNTGVATIGSASGLVTGVSAGVDTVIYILPTGCYGAATVTVNPLPTAIEGADTVCVGATSTLSDNITGGTWSSSNTGVANIGSGTGIVTGTATGTTVITYTLSTGCFITDTIHIDSLPVVNGITGLDTICIGHTAPFSDATTGGVWSSSNTSIVTIGSSTGVATGIAGGTATLSYSVTNKCGTSVVTKIVKVYDNSLPPITGPHGVCSGSTITLSDAIGGGVWTSSDGTIATVGSLSGIVTGVASGSVTITYTHGGLCGTDSVIYAVVVNEVPYITTNFVVACQTLASGGDSPGPGTILPDTGCVLVCDSSIVRYYANGVGGSMFTWSVVGGIVVTNYGDSIDVLWPMTGTIASITLYDTFSHCVAEAMACIKVIAKPHARFTTGSTSYCLADNILFVDYSTADATSPIVSWIWNFGDGTGTSIENPSHSYASAGTYTVTLVVKNACNCTDTVREVLTITTDPAPKIVCAAVVCDSESATYSTAASCGTYNWSVIGGTITGGLGTASITVKWNAVGPDGFGYVSLATPGCTGVCSDTTTIKIPVILQSPVISGPTILCANAQYEYSLPLWPATQYMWGVIGDPGAVVGFHDDHTVVVSFSTAGTYEIHGWYQNRLKLCGSSATLKVSVQAPDTISGNKTICDGYTETYVLTDGASADSWTLSNVVTGSVVATGSGTSFTHTFTGTGAYLLSAAGSFCANPITINVLGAPAAIDSVSGPDTVCIGRIYNYHAWNDIPGTIYNWQAIGGTISPATSGNAAGVTWTNTGTKLLLVSRVNTFPPYCSGPIDTVHIITDSIKLNLEGDTSACANSIRHYHANYYRGDVYDWTIFPSTAGSVTGGNHLPDNTVLWNNTATITTARLVLTVHKCDSVKTDTLTVTIHPSPGVTIVAVPSPACPDSPVVFTANTGGSLYTWNFGDGTAFVTTTTNVSPGHSYPINTTTGNINYLVTVTVIPDTSAPCPLSGTGSVTIPIKPGPVAYLSASGELTGCDTFSTLLVGTVTNNVTGLDYQWYNSSGAITGATDTTYRVYGGPASYYFGVVAANGCAAFSQTVLVNHDQCDTGHGTLHTPCDSPLVVTFHDTCNAITLFGGSASGTGAAATWSAATTPASFTYFSGGAGAVATYNEPGIYSFQLSELFATCIADTTIQDTVGLVANFRYRLKCAGGVTDSALFTDYTAYLPWWHIDTITWDTGGIILGGGANFAMVAPATSSFVMTETVSGTRPGGTFSCKFSLEIVLPARPVAAFSVAPTSICEGVAINFTPTITAGIAGYDWDFGDLASSLLQYSQRTYTWPSTPPTNPHVFSVILTVTDTIGCSASDTGAVNIYHNTLTGIYGGTGLICSSAAPDILSFAVFPATSGTPPYSYLWSNATIGNADSVYQSGSYWVTVTDAHQCLHTFVPGQNVKIVQPPTAQIYGLQNYCIGQSVNLSGYAGPGVTYAWTRNGAADGTTPAISDAGLAVDDYTYQLVLSITDTPTSTTCYDTSAIDSIHVFGLPPLPTISGPTVVDCNTYYLQLTASETPPWEGTYNWSNGTYGAVNDIYSGGPYRVWFTDLYGCTSSSDINVVQSPDTYFPYFPSGCYLLCKQELPITLPGVPDVVFNSWAWLDNGAAVESGSSSVMSAYVVDSSGDYQWSLDNGLCAKTSDTMEVTVTNCNTCQADSFVVDSIVCDLVNPAGYNLTIQLFSPGAGTAYTLGTDIGPIDPFSGTTSTYGLQPPMTLSFTTLDVPAPDSVTIEVVYTQPNGSKCVHKERIKLPSCSWPAERNGHSGDSTKGGQNSELHISTALLVYPNPATNEVTISYDYGNAGNSSKNLAIYDGMGRKIDATIPQDTHGNWNINIANWMPGVYIIRMEGDGKALQTQRIVVSH